MKKLLLTAVLACTATPSLFAQYYTNQNKVWAFGTTAGLDFTSGGPVAISTSMSMYEGSAGVCDASGNLLFYSEGSNVWDNTGAVMPSGSAIVSYSTSSATEAALIAPVIGASNQYYLFSLESWSGGTNYCHLDYCKVDMSLHGGLGDVVASTIGTTVTNKLAEKMITVRGNSGNIWLVVHKADTAQFLAYNITASGIASPVVSTVGSFTGANCYTAGALKASPDRQHLVVQVYPTASVNGTELYDFNPSTGIVSNCRTLNNSTPQYGAEFSPNSTKLYCQTWAGNVDQYDITGSTASAIIATRTAVVSGSVISDLKLGPDGKIYLRALAGATALDCITNPNASGSGCGYAAGAVTLAGSSTINMGFTNTYIADSASGSLSAQNVIGEAEIMLYPNPAHNEVFINGQGLVGNKVNVTCYNILGAAIYNKTEMLSNGSLSTSIHLADMPNGIYEVKIQDETGQNYTRSLLVK